MSEGIGQAARHDHEDCISRALLSAQTVASRQGARMTPLRRKVLAQVWRNHSAVKAYDILKALGGEDAPAKPPTVYRALHFLREHGLVHRLETLNAFVGCRDPGLAHRGQFMICERCGEVREFPPPAMPDALVSAAEAEGFLVTGLTVEMSGVCHACQQT